ncbi:hypothetical protein [Solicola gregarius]|uniref:Transcriptional regulator, AbiEi antitoxin, Type IV TA system n=1 Tax=Solicola gregarius TaxID=2908642 RepID=A0AA46TMF6_9ACTN|nr:hypothetical protein [Solicola gregarius]UYM07760.1 hypothetical protein L0C25_12035 [Solicola gregarius]
MRAVDEIIARSERVVTHAELMELGMRRSTICRRMKPGGPWQWILPGVTLCHTGTPTQRERMLAAVKYGGPGCVITGESGLREYGVRARLDPRIHILVPHDRHRSSHHFVVVERTRKLPDPVVRRGLPLAPIPRCCLDGCRRVTGSAAVRAAIAEVVQRRMCTPMQIRQTIESMATQRSGRARRVLIEIEAGIRSSAEGNARDVFAAGDVPMPEWNVELYTPDGTLLCVPDGWWDDLALALQIDSMEWHLSPELYKRTQATQRVLAQMGIPFLPWAPGDVSRDPDAFLASARAFRAGNAGRPRPDLIVVRKDADAA